MGNLCMDTVVFYAENDAQEAGLQKLKEAVFSCYPEYSPSQDTRMAKIFEQNNLSIEGLYLRGDVIHSAIEDDRVTLDCDAAWRPMWDAYNALATYFNVNLVMQAEEPGSDIYINTDSDGTYLPTHYKLVLDGRPDDNSLDAILAAADGDTDIYFDSESSLLQWFRNGGIDAKSLDELRSKLDNDYVTIHEYVNSYQED